MISKENFLTISFFMLQMYETCPLRETIDLSYNLDF